jgi:hypothetical protein
MSPTKLRSRLSEFKAEFYRRGRVLDDTHCWAILSPLLTDYPYIAFSISSMRPSCLVHILNDVVVNDRQQVIEFGAGVSTLLLARLIARNGLSTRLTSVEHDPGWAQVIRGMLERERMADPVTVVVAPLEPVTFGVADTHWYSPDSIRAQSTGATYDCVIVDGPPAWEPGKGLARYPAFPFMREHLAERCRIFLDDADREGEQRVLQLWSEMSGFEFQIRADSLGIGTRGAAYGTDPLRR